MKARSCPLKYPAPTITPWSLMPIDAPASGAAMAGIQRTRLAT
jgi:hypothetical protein